MKKALFLIGSTLTGIFASFIVHGVVEMMVIELLLYDFEKYGLGLSWETWVDIHEVGAVALLIAGIVGGFMWGVTIIKDRNSRKKEEGQ